MKRLLLLFCLLLNKPIFGQNLSFRLSASNHLEDFYHLSSMGAQPIITGSLGYNSQIGESSWFWEGNLGARYTTIKYSIDPIPPSGNPDLAIPDQINMNYLLYYLSLQSGLGYSFHFSGLQQFQLALGLQGFAGIRGQAKLNGDDFGRPLFEGKSGDYFYGLYLRPAYEFAFSKKRSNPWHFSLFASSELLLKNKSQSNPFFIWGAGLGVSYRLGNAY